MRKLLTPAILTGLRYFCLAAAQNSFTRAAQDLNLSQGAVSQQMRQLEERLGVTLFQRRPKGLVLTESGRRLYASVSQSFFQIEEAVAEIGVGNARVTLSCTPSMALQWLMPRLPRFYRLHPDIELVMKAEFQNLDRASFSEHGLDAAIRYDSFEHDDLQATVIMQEYLLPVLTPRYAETHRANLTGGPLKDLTLLYDSEPWIGAPDMFEWNAWLEANPGVNVAACPTQAFNLFALAMAAALGDQGIAIARVSHVLDDLEAGRLVAACGDAIIAPARHVLLTAPKPSTPVKVVADWLIEECVATQREVDRARDRGQLSAAINTRPH